MSVVAAIRQGQLWRSRETGERWLVTKTYTELFTVYAVLRKEGGPDVGARRVKVERTAEGVTLPGFTLVEGE
jgi:hypothetical protein